MIEVQQASKRDWGNYDVAAIAIELSDPQLEPEGFEVLARKWARVVADHLNALEDALLPLQTEQERAKTALVAIASVYRDQTDGKALGSINGRNVVHIVRQPTASYDTGALDALCKVLGVDGQDELADMIKRCRKVNAPTSYFAVKSVTIT